MTDFLLANKPAFVWAVNLNLPPPFPQKAFQFLTYNATLYQSYAAVENSGNMHIGEAIEVIIMVQLSQCLTCPSWTSVNMVGSILMQSQDKKQ